MLKVNQAEDLLERNKGGFINELFDTDKYKEINAHIWSVYNRGFDTFWNGTWNHDINAYDSVSFQFTYGGY